MKRYIVCILLVSLGYNLQAQDNYIVKTDDGRRVLLKADFTWEYIDLTAPQKKATPEKAITEAVPKTATSSCNLGLGFEEPKLNIKTQAYLKRNRSSINQLKKKVAKKEKCSVDEIKLISTTETKAKGVYNFCTCNGKVAYKRNGASFFKKGKLF